MRTAPALLLLLCFSSSSPLSLSAADTAADQTAIKQALAAEDAEVAAVHAKYSKQFAELFGHFDLTPLPEIADPRVSQALEATSIRQANAALSELASNLQGGHFDFALSSLFSPNGCSFHEYPAMNRRLGDKCLYDTICRLRKERAAK